MTGVAPRDAGAAGPPRDAGAAGPPGDGAEPDRRLDVEDLADAVLVLDAERRVVLANRAAGRLTGLAPEAMVGRSSDGMFDWHDSDGSRHLGGRWPAPARLRGTRRITPQTVTVRSPRGTTVTTTLTGSYTRDDAGRLTGAVLTLRNPGRGNRAAPSGMEIVSTVSHELRSPLTSVKGYTSLMLNRWDRLADDQKKMMLEQVNHDADRVTRLITELLDISRLETGRLTLRRQMVDLPRLAATVVEKVAMEYPELRATTEFPDSFPKVYADPDKIEQVLTNLVENACKYASPRGLRIDGAAGDNSVSVGVHDRGEGIPPSDLPKVFTKFFRRSFGRPTGSGLGLWISRGLVESHGGELRAESVVGQGSTFRFTLPLLDLDKLQEQ